MSRRVQHAYSRLAGQYISLFGSLEQVHPGDLELIGRSMADLSGPVLDLGCGPGHLAGFLRSMHTDVTGVDLVPEFIAHARAAHPGVRFEVGSLADVERPAGSVAGVLAWFSLIHHDPDHLDAALAAIRRVVATGGVFVVGFFEGPEVEPFEHKVVTAYRWPVEEMARRLGAAGFVEIERLHRAREGERRPYAAIAARAA